MNKHKNPKQVVSKINSVIHEKDNISKAIDIYSRNEGLVQCLSINQCLLPWQQTKEKKNDHLNRCGKNLWQNPTLYHSENNALSRNGKKDPDLEQGNHKNRTANTVLHGRSLKASPLRSGTRQGCAFSPPLFESKLGTPAHATRQETDMRGL